MTLGDFGVFLLQFADADSRRRSACHPDWLAWTVAAIAHVLQKDGHDLCRDNGLNFCVSVIMELQSAQRQGVIPLAEEINATWMRFSHGMTYAAVRWLRSAGQEDVALLKEMASEADRVLRPALSTDTESCVD